MLNGVIKMQNISKSSVIHCPRFILVSEKKRERVAENMLNISLIILMS